MKAASVREIKYELGTKSLKELMELCLMMSKFKKENKELLTYLLFEAEDEHAFVESIKREVDDLFEEINIASYYYIRKRARKILIHIKKHIRYSKKKETEIELLIYYCQKLRKIKPPIWNYVALKNIYERQIAAIQKSISTLHEDLQIDYESDLEELLDY
ncbi:MAG: hypothetical protein KTR26_00835 [Flammeovirgaceae bacterium]|nr:hypothetical protein [Flammeovirgaceae bacterium]